MIKGKRRFLAKVVSIIMLASTAITSDGSVLALEAGEAQEIAVFLHLSLHICLLIL